MAIALVGGACSGSGPAATTLAPAPTTTVPPTTTVSTPSTTTTTTMPAPTATAAPTTTLAPAPSTTTTTPPTTTTTFAVSSTGWSRVPHDAAIFGDGPSTVMLSVTAGGPGLVAVGWDTSSDRDAAVWTSPDGITWARVPDDDDATLAGAGNQLMVSVTAGGPGLVAVGFDQSGGDLDAAVWTSPDGIAWSRVPHDEPVYGGDGDQFMFNVTAGGAGLVAVGFEDAEDDQDAAVWTSPDGITWSRVPHDEAVFGGGGTQEMRAVTSGGPGLAAVGFDGADAAVWTSPDGITWSRVPHDEAVLGGAGGPTMNSVTAGGPGLVAVGFDDSGDDFDAAVWTSPDGITWSRVPHDELNLGGVADQEMLGVTSGGPGLVAVGQDETPDDFEAAVWTSADGITWSRVPHDASIFGGSGEQVMVSVTAGGPGLVAVGGGEFRFSQIAAVWVIATDD